MGESGIQKYTKTAQMTVRIPYVMKRPSQDFTGELEGMKEKPNARRPPTIFWIPFIIYLIHSVFKFMTFSCGKSAYHKLIILPCSSRLYHVELRITNVGWHAASKAPMKARRITKPVKLLIADIRAIQTPHRKMFSESHLAIGTRCIIQFS